MAAVNCIGQCGEWRGYARQSIAVGGLALGREAGRWQSIVVGGQSIRKKVRRQQSLTALTHNKHLVGLG